MDSQIYSGYGQIPGQYSHGPAPAMFFNHKAEKINWRRIAAVDLNRITKDLDFTALQDTITSIAFCDIEHELESKYIEPNYIRLFKLAQLQIQYLLYSQDYLTGSLSGEVEKGQAAIDELDKLRRELAGLRERQVELKKQCHRYKKMVRIQQMLMPSSHDLHHPCPHCDKKFISRDFLSQHLERRHRSLPVQPTGPAVNLSLGSASKDVEELREQLDHKSSEIELLRQQVLQGGNVDLTSFRHDMMQQHKAEMDSLRNMFMEEMKDLNSRYMASEKALQELRVKQTHGSRSNLGDLEDDDENLTNLKKQEDAKIAEENRKLKADIAREKALSEKRKVDLERQRADFESRMMEARESTQKQRKQIENESVSRKKRQLAEDNVDEGLVEKRSAVVAASGKQEAPSAGPAPSPPSQKRPEATELQSFESDDEMTDESESILVSKEMKKTLADTGPIGTGEMSATSSWDISQLRSSRVMEKLKAEPKLLQGFISELRMILEERLMELGVDKNAKRLTTPVLNEKLAILRKERDQLTRKHSNFAAIRQQFVREVEKDARDRLKAAENARVPPPGHSPPGQQRKMAAVGGPRPPPRPSPQSERRSATLPSRPTENPPRSHPAVPSLQQRDLQESETETETDDESYSLDDPQPLHMNGVQPTAPPAHPVDSDVRPSPRKPRQHRPLSASNGLKLDSPDSLADWDTTDGKKLSLQLNPRGGQAEIVIPSRSAKKEVEESDDDWDDDEEIDDLQQLEDELAGGSRVDYLRQSLEQQLHRPRDSKAPPAGGVRLFPGSSSGGLSRSNPDDDDPLAGMLDDEDDAFDVSSLNGEDSRPPSRKISASGLERGLFGGNGARASVGSSGGAGAQTTSPSGQLRLSAAGTDLSNTFGTSQWGTTSKVVSTVNPGATQKSMATNKSSDVGGDDDFDSD